MSRAKKTLNDIILKAVLNKVHAWERMYAEHDPTADEINDRNWLGMCKVLRDRIEELEEDKTPCYWKYDDSDFDYSCWEGSCGAAWYLEEGTPKENNMDYCPECGGDLVEVYTSVT